MHIKHQSNQFLTDDSDSSEDGPIGEMPQD